MKRLHSNTSKIFSQAQYYRDRIELLRIRISLLAGTDRVLMTMYLEHGNSFRQISKLTGINESNVARRIYKITKRLMDGSFICCLRNRDRLTSVEMKIAKAYFINGMSMAKISETKNLSYYKVRKAMRKIEAIVVEEDKRRLHREKKEFRIKN